MYVSNVAKITEFHLDANAYVFIIKSHLHQVRIRTIIHQNVTGLKMQ